MHKDEKEVLKVRSNSPIIFTLILIMIFIISISYMAFYQLGVFRVIQKASIINETANQDITTGPTSLKLADNYNNATLENETVKEVTSTYSGGLQNINNYQNNSQIYEMIKAPDLPEQSSNTLTHKNIKPISVSQNDYRNYLLNVNLLTANFLQDKHYREQIYKIQELELPQDIQDILKELLNYHEHYLLNNSTKAEKIFPSSTCWLEKFIKIEKISLPHKDQKILQQRIMRQLDFLINYFYSQKFQQKFIEENND